MARLQDVEQMTGIEPAPPVWRTGVPPWHCIRLVVPGGTGFANRRRCRSTFDGSNCPESRVLGRTASDSFGHRVGRVGIEPTWRRIKSPLQGQHLLSTRWLRCVVPPSGIEPEPLGLQPSAQTNYARVGTSAARVFSTRGADHHHRSSIVRELRRKAHLGRQCTRLLRGRTHHDSRSGLEISSRKVRCSLRFGRWSTRNVERPPGFPGAALQHSYVQVCTLTE